MGMQHSMSAADGQFFRVRASAGIDRVLIGERGLIFTQNRVFRHAVCHQHGAHKSPFGFKAALISPCAGLLTGKCARRDGKAAGGEEQRRIALMIQLGGIFRRFGVAVAGDKEDICLLWLIAQKDEARDVVDPFKHGVEPFRPAGRRACRRRKRCAQPETGTAGR